MEATRDPDLAEALRDLARAELVDVVDGILDAAGHAHSRARSATLVAALDGVLMAALLQADAYAAATSRPVSRRCSRPRRRSPVTARRRMRRSHPALLRGLG